MDYNKIRIVMASTFRYFNIIATNDFYIAFIFQNPCQDHGTDIDNFYDYVKPFTLSRNKKDLNKHRDNRSTILWQ